MNSRQSPAVIFGNNNISIQDIRESVITINQIIKEDSSRIEIPLSPNESERFKAAVVSYTMKYEEDPSNPPDFDSKINPIMQKVINNPLYEKQYPFHVGMLYRLYCSIYLVCELTTNKDWDVFYNNIQHILQYSTSLLENNAAKMPSDYDGYYHRIMSQLPMYKDAIADLKKSFKDFNSDMITMERFQDVLSCNLVFALPTKTENAIQRKAEEISSIMFRIVTGPTRDFKFLMELKNNAYSSMEKAISLIKNELLLRNENPIERLPNPYYYELTDGLNKGKTQVDFVFFDEDRTLEFTWIVSASMREVGSITNSYAQTLTNFWFKNLINTKSTEIILSTASLEETFDEALADIDKRTFMKAIMKLLKVTSLKDEWAEPHWHLSKALYGNLTMKGKRSDIDKIQEEIKKIGELPEGQKQKKFEEYLENAPSDESEALHHVLISNYPKWISEELKAYLKYDPNGKYANDAHKLLQTLSTMI